jgi:hypothetical protein
MASTWISFGPDLEPLTSESRRHAGTPLPRRDGLLVTGEPAEVAARLADALKTSEGWCELETPDGGGPRKVVHVNARTVRFVAPADDDPE